LASELLERIDAACSLGTPQHTAWSEPKTGSHFSGSCGARPAKVGTGFASGRAPTWTYRM